MTLVLGVVEDKEPTEIADDGVSDNVLDELASYGQTAIGVGTAQGTPWRACMGRVAGWEYRASFLLRLLDA